MNNILLWLIFELELLLPSGVKMAKWAKSQNLHCLLSPRRLKLASTLETQIWVNYQNFKRRIKLEIIIFPCGKVLPYFKMKDVLRKVIFRQDVERRINGHSLRERHRLFSFQHKKSLSQKSQFSSFLVSASLPYLAPTPHDQYLRVGEVAWDLLSLVFSRRPNMANSNFGCLAVYVAHPQQGHLWCVQWEEIKRQFQNGSSVDTSRVWTVLHASHLGRRSIIIVVVITSGSRKWWFGMSTILPTNILVG